MAESRVWVERNRYHDSVSLMVVADAVRAVPGVLEAVLVMGTPMNRTLLERVELLLPEAAEARPMDLVIGVKAGTAQAAEKGLAEARRLLSVRSARGLDGPLPYSGDAPTYHTLRAAVREEPDLDFAFISVPGEYAGWKARRALKAGLDVMIYSDNVPLSEEVALKRLAVERGLLCLGPDCGTAILGGVGLGFANAVRRGPIGIVAASGTGAQELCCLIHRMGSGITNLFGVGGRDLTEEVGGLMSLEALARLQADWESKVIVLIAKPPAPGVRALLEERAAAGPKPVLFCFLDGSNSIDEVAARAIAQALGCSVAEVAAQVGLATDGSFDRVQERFRPGAGRSRLVGLFSGGSLCDQALAILEQRLGRIACNVHPVPEWRVEGYEPKHEGHLLLDLGADEFTLGRPHPMIDFGLRREFIRWAADQPETAAILLDCVLGWGANPNPAGAMAEAIEYATSRGVQVVAAVTGTDEGIQGYDRQVRELREAGALVMPTARQAALVVAESMAEEGGR